MNMKTPLPWHLTNDELELDEYGNVLRGEYEILSKDENTSIAQVAGGIPAEEHLDNAWWLVMGANYWEQLFIALDNLIKQRPHSVEEAKKLRAEITRQL